MRDSHFKEHLAIPPLPNLGHSNLITQEAGNEPFWNFKKKVEKCVFFLESAD